MLSLVFLFALLPAGAMATERTALSITAQPVDFTGQLGDAVSFTVAASGEGLSYQWQYSSDGGATWGNSGLPGNKSATLTTTLTEARLIYRFRCVVTDCSGESVNSNIVRMIKKAELAITSQPTDFIGRLSDAVSFTVGATGDGLSYQWQYSSDGGATWKASGLPGNKTATLTTELTDARLIYRFRCVVSDSSGESVNSNIVRMIKKAELAITSQPVDFTGKLGDAVSFTVGADGDGLTYQWQYSNDGGRTWGNSGMPGNKTATLSTTLTDARLVYRFRCVVSDSSGKSVNSNIVRMIKKAELAITSQPVDFTGKLGDTVSFTVGADGDGLSYQWQYSNDGGATWKASGLPGNKTATLTTELTDARLIYRFRCVVTDAYGDTEISNAVRITKKALDPEIDEPDNPQGSAILYLSEHDVTIGQAVFFNAQSNLEGVLHYCFTICRDGYIVHTSEPQAQAEYFYVPDTPGASYSAYVTVSNDTGITATSASLPFTVETTPLQATVLSQSGDIELGQSIDVEISVSGGMGTIHNTYLLVHDSQTTVNVSETADTSYSFTPISAGEYSLTILSEDAVGTTTVTVVDPIRVSAPEPRFQSIIVTPAELSIGSAVTVSVEADDVAEDAVYTYRVCIIDSQGERAYDTVLGGASLSYTFTEAGCFRFRVELPHNGTLFSAVSDTILVVETELPPDALTVSSISFSDDYIMQGSSIRMTAESNWPADELFYQVGVYCNGVKIDTLSAKGSVLFTPETAGVYSFSFEISNSAGNSDYLYLDNAVTVIETWDILSVDVSCPTAKTGDKISFAARTEGTEGKEICYSYSIYLNGLLYRTEKDLTTTSVSLDTIRAGTYSCIVTAQDRNGIQFSAESQEVMVTDTAISPDQSATRPILLVPASEASISLEDLTLQWMPVNGATEYKITLDYSCGANWHQLLDVTVGSNTNRYLISKSLLRNGYCHKISVRTKVGSWRTYTGYFYVGCKNEDDCIELTEPIITSAYMSDGYYRDKIPTYPFYEPVPISWTNVPAAEYYSVQLTKIERNEEAVTLTYTNITTNYFEVPLADLTSGARYRVYVYAHHTEECAEKSDYMYFRAPYPGNLTLDPTSIISPDLSKDESDPTVITTQNLTLVWEPVSAAVRYQVEVYDPIDEVTDYAIDNLTACTVTIPKASLWTGIPYCIYISAYDQQGHMTYEEYYVKLQASAMEKPVLLSPSLSTDRENSSTVQEKDLSIIWGSVEGAARYSVTLYDYYDDGWDKILSSGSIAGTSYTLPKSELYAGGRFKLYIRAEDTYGNMEKSVPYYFTVGPASTMELSLYDQFYSDSSGTKYVGLTSSSAWTAQATASWITLSKTAGTGSDRIGISVAANSGDFPRSGTVTFRNAAGGCAVFSVTQAGNEQSNSGALRITSPGQGTVMDYARFRAAWIYNYDHAYFEVELKNLTASRTVFTQSRVITYYEDIPVSALAYNNLYLLTVSAFNASGIKVSEASVVFRTEVASSGSGEQSDPEDPYIDDEYTYGETEVLYYGILSGSVIEQRDIDLAWKQVLNAGYYWLALRDSTLYPENNTGTRLIDKRIETLNEKIAAGLLTPGHSYNLWIAAHTEDGALINGKNITFTVRTESGLPEESGSAEPIVVNVTYPRNGQTLEAGNLTIRWDPFEEASSFFVALRDITLYPSANGGAENSIYHNMVNGTSLTIAAADLPPGHDFRLWVEARNAAGSCIATRLLCFTVAAAQGPETESVPYVNMDTSDLNLTPGTPYYFNGTVYSDGGILNRIHVTVVEADTGRFCDYAIYDRAAIAAFGSENSFSLSNINCISTGVGAEIGTSGSGYADSDSVTLHPTNAGSTYLVKIRASNVGGRSCLLAEKRIILLAEGGSTTQSEVDLNISETAWTAESGSTLRIVEVEASAAWSVESCPDWIRLGVVPGDASLQDYLQILSTVSADHLSGLRQSGVWRLILMTENNVSGQARSGQIKLRSGSMEKTIRIFQQADDDAFAPRVTIVNPVGGSNAIYYPGEQLEIEVSASGFESGELVVRNPAGSITRYPIPSGVTEIRYELSTIGIYTITVGVNSGATTVQTAGDYDYSQTVSISVVPTPNTDGDMQVSRALIDYLAKREGKHDTVYRDVAGKDTIGIGHCLTEKEKEAGTYYNVTLSDAQIEALFRQDIAYSEGIVNRFMRKYDIHYSQNQFDALVSFSFNLGDRFDSKKADGSPTRFNTYMKQFGAEIGDQLVSNLLVNWHHANKLDVKGLYFRRFEEALIFTRGIYEVRYDWPIPFWLKDGAVGEDVPNDWYPDLDGFLSLSSYSVSGTAAGGTGSVLVTSSGPWQAVTSTPWIEIINGNGSGNGTLSFRMTGNLNSNARNADITVTSQGMSRVLQVVQVGTVQENLTASAAVTSQAQYVGDTAEITVESHGGSGAYQFILQSYRNGVLEDTVSSRGQNVLSAIPKNDGTYYFIVTVTDGTGNSVTARTANITVNSRPLVLVDFPSDGGMLSAQSLPDIQWEPAVGAVSYQIRVRNLATGRMVISDENAESGLIVNGTTFALSRYTLPEASQFRLWIGAYDANGAKVAQTQRVFSTYTLPSIEFTSPAGTEIDPAGDVEVTWQAASGDVMYKWVVKNLTTDMYLRNELTAVTGGILYDDELTEGSSYRMHISAYSKDGARVAECSSSYTFTYCPSGASSGSETYGNLAINGVDLLYAPGEYFSTTGMACKCHNRGTCGVANDCTCISSFMDTRGYKADQDNINLGFGQCKGFALYCQVMLYGSREPWTDNNVINAGTTSGGYKNFGSWASGNTAALKALITEAGVGAHIRTSGIAHSMIVARITNEGFTVFNANGSMNKEYTYDTSDEHTSRCRIGTYTYTWESYANSTYGQRGIKYISNYVQSDSGSSDGGQEPPAVCRLTSDIDTVSFNRKAGESKTVSMAYCSNGYGFADLQSQNGIAVYADWLRFDVTDANRLVITTISENTTGRDRTYVLRLVCSSHPDHMLEITITQGTEEKTPWHTPVDNIICSWGDGGANNSWLCWRGYYNPSPTYGSDKVNSDWHLGIDVRNSSPEFGTKAGAPIYAVADGVVTNVATTDKNGNNVTLYHSEEGVTTFYAHLQSYCISIGDTVSKGQQIGVMGSSGTDNVHLHFAVIKGKVIGDFLGYAYITVGDKPNYVISHRGSADYVEANEFTFSGKTFCNPWTYLNR